MKIEEPPQSEATILILKKLSDLDRRAEEIGATDIRKSIACVIDDLSWPAGKENARIAIREFEAKLDSSTPKKSQTSLSSMPPDAHLEEAIA